MGERQKCQKALDALVKQSKTTKLDKFRREV